MNNERLLKLILLYKAKELSEDESIELNRWIEESEGNRKEFNRLTDSKGIKHYMEFKTRMAKVMEEKTLVRGIATRYYWQKLAAVAAVLIIVAGIYLWRSGLDGTKPASPQTQQQYSSTDVAPGKYKALLRLSDGRQVVLDSAGNGLLAQQGKTNIYSEGGTLKYSPGNSSNNEVLYNTLETATGETYTVTLPDGSRVWLNSQSSIKFPVSFNGTERNVEMQGEVYFEVNKNEKQPFTVKVNNEQGNNSEVQVLGTHFNINAYSDEPVAKTTLLEGRVAIKSGANHSEFLNPGQQARLDENGIIKVVSNINTDAVIAWKDQTFYFESQDLKTLMRQLSRWYGITVKYDGNIPDRHFGGMVSRNRNLSEVLKMLEKSEIYFKINGKELTVMP